MANPIRWKQRLENFERAILLLKEALETRPGGLSDLEKEGVVQRFEYTFELAWKTLKDYLVYSGFVFDQITPRRVVKQAFAARIIKDGQLWIEMLEQRNLMSHVYDRETFDAVFRNIAQRYVGALEQAYVWLRERTEE